jgi:hypothetical protein|nr:MAG TPA: hypothetical protein [Caudoviricetes sp.]
MLNKSGIIKEDYATPKQILADPSLQFSVGCLVPADIKNTKAGTPIYVDLSNINVACKKVDNTATFANAVLLHDVDVSNGQTNGTALIFGFVDLSKVDTTTQGLLKTALSTDGATKLITLVNHND